MKGKYEVIKQVRHYLVVSWNGDKYDVHASYYIKSLALTKAKELNKSNTPKN